MFVCGRISERVYAERFVHWVSAVAQQLVERVVVETRVTRVFMMSCFHAPPYLASVVSHT